MTGRLLLTRTPPPGRVHIATRRRLIQSRLPRASQQLRRFPVFRDRNYLAGRLWLRRELASRTVSIEVGMQNSGLGVVLAQQNFASPLVALPSAISAVFHSLVGSLAAAAWRATVATHQAR